MLKTYHGPHTNLLKANVQKKPMGLRPGTSFETCGARFDRDRTFLETDNVKNQ